jgi:hypothetical protein
MTFSGDILKGPFIHFVNERQHDRGCSDAIEQVFFRLREEIVQPSEMDSFGAQIFCTQDHPQRTVGRSVASADLIMKAPGQPMIAFPATVL